MKQLIFILCLLATTFNMAAQQAGQQNKRHQFSPERYKQRLEEFVTKEADLTADEAARLFPLLHEMQEKQRKNNDAAGMAMMSCKEGSSEADYEKAIKQATGLDLENKKIEQEYYKKFHTVLSWKKVHGLRVALWKFQMEALRKFTPHDQMRDGNNSRKNLGWHHPYGENRGK